ncbi:hypothetical protein G647_10151 [Cladophialophora carrionii CBS 160.54]|uniref:Transposase Tc1-like domain-containing protein n=1 Tax=Cladophialophora carrionii CBS 160.54 TaxID=1279043 RepID=V9DM69_9EURO|nr:uncharacterized protein G647_10151 [Cladophialophora carrionii CBS 160.54]ETI27052.1 hypothetical protein G647_10151 [Cladophialophora carrionii CBS 160.54]
MVSGGYHFRYSDEVRNLVLVQLAAGVKPSDIAAALGVSQPFISQVKTRSAIDPEILERNRRPRGRPPKVPDYAFQGVKGYLAEHPAAERRAIQQNLKERFNIDVHLTTIGRLVQALKSGKDRRTTNSSTITTGQTSSTRTPNEIDSTSNSTAASSTSRKRKANHTD